jgi:hypothetical protein
VCWVRGDGTPGPPDGPTVGEGEAGLGYGGGTGAGGWFSKTLTAMNNATVEIASTTAKDAT